MVDWQTRMMHIWGTKIEARIKTPLNDMALKWDRARDAGDGRVFRAERPGLHLERIRHWFDPALEEENISGLQLHRLSHTFAGRLREKATPQENIAELRGLKGFAIMRPHAQSEPRCLHEVVARLVKKRVDRAQIPA